MGGIRRMDLSSKEVAIRPIRAIVYLGRTFKANRCLKTPQKLQR